MIWFAFCACRYTPSASGKIPPEVKEKPDTSAVAAPKKPRQLDGYVGFANLPNQVRARLHYLTKPCDVGHMTA